MICENWLEILASPQLWMDYTAVAKILGRLSGETECNEILGRAWDLRGHLELASRRIRMDPDVVNRMQDFILRLESKDPMTLQDLLDTAKFVCCPVPIQLSPPPPPTLEAGSEISMEVDPDPAEWDPGFQALSPASPSRLYLEIEGLFNPKSVPDAWSIRNGVIEPALPEIMTWISTSINSIHRDIEKWKREEVNKEAGKALVGLDDKFLDMVEVEVGKVMEQILSLSDEAALNWLKDFLERLVVVTRQPKRIIQAPSVIETEVRLLLPAQLTSIVDCTVGMTFINEKGEEILREELGKEGVELTNSANKIKEGLTFALKQNIPAKAFKKRKQQGTPSVLDQNSYIRYEFQLTLQKFSGSPNLTTRTYSFPIKARVNNSQDSSGWQTLLWDKAAYRFGFTRVERPEYLHFGDLVEPINAFLPATKLPLGLSAYEVVFGLIHPSHQLVVNKRFMSSGGQETIGLEEFRLEKDAESLDITLKVKQTPAPSSSKDENEDNKKASMKTAKKPTISYFSWFYKLKKFLDDSETHHKATLVKATLVPWAWRYGHIVGYLTTEETETLLTGMPSGTFLIRFSNSRPDAVAVAWKQIDDDEIAHFKAGEVYKVFWDSGDLIQKSLKDRILESPEFRTHYPSGSNKEALFDSSNSKKLQVGPGRPGYVLNSLVPIMSNPSHHHHQS